MVTTVKVSTIYHCSLENAFRIPILGDVTKVHTGYGLMPRVTHSADDSDWGKPGSSKKIFVEKSLTQKGGFAFMDHVKERKENEYWILQVDQFQSWMLGFYKFVGEWRTTAIDEQKTRVDYIYHLHSKGLLLYPLCWIFGKTFWKIYMKKVLENVRKMLQAEKKSSTQ